MAVALNAANEEPNSMPPVLGSSPITRHSPSAARDKGNPAPEVRHICSTRQPQNNSAPYGAAFRGCNVICRPIRGSDLLFPFFYKYFTPTEFQFTDPLTLQRSGIRGSSSLRGSNFQRTKKLKMIEIFAIFAIFETAIDDQRLTHVPPRTTSWHDRCNFPSLPDPRIVFCSSWWH